MPRPPLILPEGETAGFNPEVPRNIATYYTVWCYVDYDATEDFQARFDKFENARSTLSGQLMERAAQKKAETKMHQNLRKDLRARRAEIHDKARREFTNSTQQVIDGAVTAITNRVTSSVNRRCSAIRLGEQFTVTPQVPPTTIPPTTVPSAVPRRVRQPTQRPPVTSQQVPQQVSQRVPQPVSGVRGLRGFNEFCPGVYSFLVDQPRGQCTVCLRNYQHDDDVTQLRCAHQYHSECIHRWVVDEHHNTCPMCRAEALPSGQALTRRPPRLPAAGVQPASQDSDEALDLHEMFGN